MTTPTSPALPKNKVSAWLDRPLIAGLPGFTYELAIFIGILLLAVVSRFYILGARAMSHDESLHTYYSWLLYKGQGYQHNPMMHGPLQFHLIALSYFMFGANDFTARIPAATFGILMIASVWIWRRYLGRAGALVAALLALISPYLLYYTRYTREDPYVGVSLFIMLYSILRYFETGRHKYIYYISGALVLHFLTKETSFIYAAQILIFLAIYFIAQVTQRAWQLEQYYRPFIIALCVGMLVIGAGLGLGLYGHKAGLLSPTETAAPAVPTDTGTGTALKPITVTPVTGIVLAGVLIIAAAGYLLIRGYGLENIRRERSFDLLIVFGTLVLPMLAPFPVKFAGWNPLDYTTAGIVHTLIFLVPFIIISMVVGLWWNFEVWWKMALVFWAPYTLLYTTIFTNGAGFLTGIVGSLGYWLEQQGVERGSQPWYFYVLIQIPIYEFLPALGSLFAFFLSLRRVEKPEEVDESEWHEERASQLNLHALLGFWTVTSIIAFTVAGEKMPWLTFHIALPMVLWAGWGIGQLIETTDWEGLRERKGLLVIAAIFIFMMSTIMTLMTALGPTPPFQGNELAQLQATSTFTLGLIVALISGWCLFNLLKTWETSHFFRLLGLAFFTLLTILTVHATILANYINYDNAKEYIVYAHSFSGVKDVMKQVTEISERVSGGTSMQVGYDDDVPWPFSWYLRDFTNQRFYGKEPTKDLRNVPVIIVGDNNFSKIEPIVGQAYYRFDYIRMVWPNQDYFNLTWERIKPFFTDGNVRAGIFDIWLNRDYTRYAKAIEQYAKATNPYFDQKAYTLENWSPSDRMRLYVRKDIAKQIWNYGSLPANEVVADPYEKGTFALSADLIVDGTTSGAGAFNSPRDLAFAPDGTLYVADSRNHRIVHLSAEGEFIYAWGTYMDNSLQPAAPGTFNEPWGIAVGPEGSVYVSDTWNYRVQKFTADGKFVSAWSSYGPADALIGFYGPRGIAVDAQGRVYVADTGNKHIVVFDSNGKYISHFGETGMEAGQFDEPVDVFIDKDGLVYVTDTWNQRVQVFVPSAEALTHMPIRQWEVYAWFGQSLDNKPYIAVSNEGSVFITDPENYRVIQFTSEGNFLRTWGGFGSGNDSFGLTSGIKVDAVGNVWVLDAANNRLMRFKLP